jgi:hypothetical protein
VLCAQLHRTQVDLPYRDSFLHGNLQESAAGAQRDIEAAEKDR